MRKIIRKGDFFFSFLFFFLCESEGIDRTGTLIYQFAKSVIIMKQKYDAKEGKKSPTVFFFFFFLISEELFGLFLTIMCVSVPTPPTFLLESLQAF